MSNQYLSPRIPLSTVQALCKQSCIAFLWNFTGTLFKLFFKIKKKIMKKKFSFAFLADWRSERESRVELTLTNLSMLYNIQLGSLLSVRRQLGREQ